MFRNFEWDNSKIATDHDEMIGPEEGKIMQPLVVMMYLDKSHDGQLSKQEALFILKKYGGEGAFRIADKNADNKLDRYEFMSYYSFASCIDCKTKEEQDRQKEYEQIKEEGKQKMQKQKEQVEDDQAHSDSRESSEDKGKGNDNSRKNDHEQL